MNSLSDPVHLEIYLLGFYRWFENILNPNMQPVVAFSSGLLGWVGFSGTARSLGWKSSVKIPKAALKVSVFLHCSTNQPCHDKMKILLPTPEVICPHLGLDKTKPLHPSSLLLRLCAVVIHTRRRNHGLWMRKSENHRIVTFRKKP